MLFSLKLNIFAGTDGLNYTEYEVLNVGFGERLRKRRKELGLRQEDIAEHLGVRISTVSQWETSTHTPDIDTVQMLAQHLKTSSDYLLGLTDDPTPAQQKSIQSKPTHPNTRTNREKSKAKRDRLASLLEVMRDESGSVPFESLIVILRILVSAIANLVSETPNLSEKEKARLMNELQSVIAEAKEVTLEKGDSIDISDLDDEMKEDARKYVEWLRTKQKLSPNQDETSAGLEDLDKRKAEGE